MITQRVREFDAPREAVWAIVGDPYHEPRWWPMTSRVERVSRRGWTAVAISSRGNAVRTDWRVEANEEPTRRRWSQELDDTAFAKVFKANAREVRLDRAASGAGTRVTLVFDQQVRGLARFVPVMLKRAMRRQLEEALDGLAHALGEG